MGALVTNDKGFFERAYYYWDHCREKGRVLFNSAVGVKYKMSNIQAALGCAQLERAEEIIEKRRRIFSWYAERLGAVEGLTLNAERADCRSNFYVPTIIVGPDFSISPTELMERMDEHGVRNRPFFRPLSKFPMFEAADTPVADHLASRGINLPCASKLTEEDVDFASSIIKKYLN